MKLVLALLIFYLSCNVYADELEALALKELPAIAAVYADGYAHLDKSSLKTKLVYKDKEGECTILATFRMEGFGGAPTYTQFVGLFNCPSFHRLIKSNKKLFLSDMYRFYMGEPYLDIDSASIDDNLIKVQGMSHKTKRPVTAIFEPSRGPGWWRLKQVQGMAEHEVLSGM